MHEEIELKLQLAPQDLQKLQRNSLLKSLRTGPGTTKRLRSTYYDTPAQTLRRYGIALRVRQDGNVLTQTLKAPLQLARGSVGAATAGGGLQRMREFEHPLPFEAPDLSLIEDAELQELFATESVPGELEALFTTEFERRTVPVEMADSAVEVAFDKGLIVSGDDRQELCEVELELRSGKPARLYELAMLLHRQVPFRLERRSKAARGYELYSQARPVPHKAAKPLLEPGMTVAQAFVAQARSCLWQVRANEDAVLEGNDPEGVHQMRVALRRLRALVTCYKPVFAEEAYTLLRDELRWLQQQLGPAREWDVFLTETLAAVRHRLPSEDSLERLEREAEELRRDAYEVARGAVRDARYTDLLLRLELWLDEGGWRKAAVPGQDDPGDRPVEPFARAILDRRAKKVRKLGKRHETLGEGELHRLRIQGKKLRYAAEFFAGLFPKKATKAYVKRLESIQDRLGAVNDAATGQRLLDELDSRIASARSDEDGRAGETVAANATGIVLGWQAAQMDRELAAFHATWDAFAEAKPFWKKG